MQVVGIPITDEQVPYLTDVALQLREKGIRVEIDDSDDRMQKKIRNGQQAEDPVRAASPARPTPRPGRSPSATATGRSATASRSTRPSQQIADWVAARHNVDPSAEAEPRPPDEPATGGAASPVVRRRRRAGDGLRAPLDAVPDGLHPRRGQAHRRRTTARSAVIPTMSDEDGLIVARGTTVFAVLNLYPYNAGHLMVVPYRHVPDYTDLTAEEVAELGAFTQTAMRVDPRGQRRARLQHRHEPGRGRRRRHRRPPAPARRAALGRRHQLHAGHRPDPGAAAGAGETRALLAEAWADAAVAGREA